MTKQRLMLAFTLLGVFFLLLSGGPVTAVAQGGPVVSAEGAVEPLQFANLSFQIGGTVSEVLVAEGDVVAAGDPLVRLDAAELQIGLAQAEARLTAATAAQAAAQNQLLQAQAAVNSATIQLEAAQANLALVQAGPLAAEIAAAEASLAAAQSAVVQAAANRDAALTIADTADIQQAEANLAQATADLRALQEGYQDILDSCFDTPNGEVCPLYGTVEESTRNQLEVAQLNQAAAQAALEALRDGATPAQQQAANGAVALAIANRDAAQARLDLLLAGATPEQVRLAEVGVAQAEVGIEIAQVGVTQAEAAIAQSEAGIQAAEAAVSAAQALLERATLRAVFNGTVARLNTAEGELVGSGVPVVTLADFSGWLVKTTDLTELDVALVMAGAPVAIRVDALPDEVLAGIVSDIALVSNLSRGDVVYEVEIRLNTRPDLPLRWGMTAFADIDTN